MKAPVVILYVGCQGHKRQYRLHLKEMRGRGRMAEVQVAAQPTKVDAIALLLQRAQGWSAADLRIIKDEAYWIMWNSPWPLTDEWLKANAGEYRL